MARPSSRHPTELELEILKILWRDGPLPVREVREALVGFRELAHTSVMTIMNIMLEKGYLSRKKEGAVYVYRPQVARMATTARMLRDLVERVYDGSAATVMVNLLDSSDLDDAEIEKIRELLNRKSGDRQS